MTDNTKMREEFARLKRHERHCNAAETRYWCDQCRMFAEGLLKQQAAQSEQSVPPKPDYSVTQLQRLKALMSELGLATDESLEAFCLDADRQLSRAITATEKTLKRLLAAQSVPVDAELDALRKDAERYRWQPIETAPKDESAILLGLPAIGALRHEGRRVYEGRWHGEQFAFTSIDGFILLDGAITWMPLPPPPISEEAAIAKERQS